MSLGLGVESVATQPVPMTPDQMKRFLSSEIQNAMTYIDSSENISSSRYRNWEYYRGVMNDLPTLKGQSVVVSSEVSDYIQMLLPSLLRPFTSGDKLWNYTPNTTQLTEQAKSFTQYINEVVFRKDNRGEIILNNWGFDACVQKNGVVKVWWDESKTYKDSTFNNLNDGEYALKGQSLGADEEITNYERKPNPQIPDGHLHDMQVRKTIDTSKTCVAPIPIEEFIISRDARDYDNAVLKCHRTGIFAGELISDAYPTDTVNRLPTYNETRSQLTRPGTAGREQNRQNIGDPAMRKVMIYEGIIRCNYDGTGVRDWYFKAGGQDGGVELLDIEPYESQIFFCEFCPEPIPHQFVGTCPADRLSEIQKVNTVLIRQALQNIYLTNAPQREVVADNILSPEQLMNYAPGASIMVKATGSVNAIPLPFSAQYAFQAIQYFDSKASDRVGVSRQSAGLDPDALQNQSATAANLAWNASMGRIEMITKIWANTGMRQLGEAIKATELTYRQAPRVVQMGGETVTIDPRMWQGLADAEVKVTTGLGTGHRDRDTALLLNVLKLQYEWLGKFGPTPVVTFSSVAQTCQKIVETGGISDPESYFGTVPANWAPPPPPPPQPTPDTVLKTKADVAQTQMQEQTKQTDISAKSQLKLREQDMQAFVSLLETMITHSHKDARMPTAFPGTGP